MFIFEETSFSQNGAEGRRCYSGTAVPGCHGSGRYRPGSNRRGREASRRLLLYSSRRHHVQHRARPRHGPVDTERFRRRLQTERDHVAAGAFQEVRFDHRESGERRERRFGTHAESCHLAELQRPGQGGGASLATTIDQIIAKKISQDTTLPSLEVSSETTVQQAAGNGGFYTTLSFRDANSPLPMEYNPKKVFNSVVRRDHAEGTRRIARETDSLLDLDSGCARSLFRTSLGAGDRATLDEYLESVREIERRTQIVAPRIFPI